MLDPLTIRRMDERAGEGPLLVALSGGGDSVALLHLLRERFGAHRLRAAVVDHKLREDSHLDAARAADLANSVGVEPLVLEVSWSGRTNRAHEAARSLRYRALCEAARTLGAHVIAAGHTRDDQAETVLLRASRASGLRGLGGMRPFAPAPVWPEGRGLWLARPLLGARRTELRTYLGARKAAWIEDPANANDIYARVRARRALAQLENAGFDPMRLAALAERLQPSAESVNSQAASLIAGAVLFEEGTLIVDMSHWRGGNVVKQRALETLVIAASGAERGAAPAQIERLCASIESAGFNSATLGGALIQRRGARVSISRDAGALAGRADGKAPAAPLVLPVGIEVVWDGRVALTASEPGWAVVFDGAGPALHRGEERRALAAASPHWLLREHVQHVLGMD